MKRFKTVVTMLIMAVLANITAFAGAWVQNAQGWWYNNGNGTWPANTWQWIDGNNDGVAECYYFDPNGYCLMNTSTPDGYQVNVTGAWTINGVVQAKMVGATMSSNSSQQSGQSDASYEEVVKAYKTYMLQKDTDRYNPIRYSLVYLDGDSVPELIFTDGSYHYKGVTICTYQNGTVRPVTMGNLDEFGASGSIIYYPGTGYFESEDGHMGYAENILYLMQGATAKEVCYMNYIVDTDAASTATTEYDEFRINGVNTTRTNAENLRNQLVSALTPVVFRYDDATKLQ